MVGESNLNAFLIQIDASSFAEFEISEFEISRFDCTFIADDIKYIFFHYMNLFSSLNDKLSFRLRLIHKYSNTPRDY